MIGKLQDLEIKDEDIKIENYGRSEGAGGQHCGTNFAVKITHIPTGIVVKADEHFGHKNKELALKMLKLRLYRQSKVFEKLLLLEQGGYEFRLYDEEDLIYLIETPFRGLYNDPINLYFNDKNKDLYFVIQDAGSNAEQLEDKRIQNILKSLDVKVVDKRLALVINLKEASLPRTYNLINAVIQVNTLVEFLKGEK